MASERYTLIQDRRGVVWDALLYAPTVGGLAIAALIFWYQGNHPLGYLLLFLATFFLLQAINRILGRMLMLPSAPVALDVSKQRILLEQRNGQRVELVKGVRYFADYAGKTFALSGMDINGARKQFVFHKGHFVDADTYKKVNAALKVYA